MPSRKSPLFPDGDFLLPLGPGEVLRGVGFKRAGRNFVRNRGGTVDGVYFRTSTFGAWTFQVIASVFHRGHHERVSGRPFPSNPFPGRAIPLAQTEVLCLLQDGSKSPWWQIRFGVEIGPIAEALAFALRDTLPFFESWSDEAVKARLLSLGAGHGGS